MAHPLAQILGVLGHLPWPVFLVGWTGLLIATYAWITQRYALVLLGLFPAAILELINGNIHLLLAAAIDSVSGGRGRGRSCC